jgi:hypothetical protein
MSHAREAERSWERRRRPARARGAACGALLLAFAAPGPGAAASERSLVELLNGAGQYVVEYEKSFSMVVANEEYVQRLRVAPGSTLLETRRLRSDVVFVSVPASGIPWWLLRDVYQVNGSAVRDREARLEQLLLSGPGDGIARARAIADEGTRFNLGSAFRNFNVPTLVLLFLHPSLQARFSWEVKGVVSIEGRRFSELEFRELGGKTVIRGPDSHPEVPASGRVLIHDGTDGVVARTTLQLDVRGESATTRVQLTTEYRPSQALGLWVPVEMAERLQSDTVGARGRVGPFEYIEGLARYSGFRRAGVTTDETFRLQEEPSKEKQP